MPLPLVPLLAGAAGSLFVLGAAKLAGFLSEEVEDEELYKNKVWITRIEIEDEIFSRRGAVRCNYRMSCSLGKILKATKILQRLDVRPYASEDPEEPIDSNEEAVRLAWNSWSQTLIEASGTGSLWGVKQGPAIDYPAGYGFSSPCTVISFVNPPQASTGLPTESTPEESNVIPKPKDDEDYMDFHQRMVVYQEGDTETYSYLDATPAVTAREPSQLISFRENTAVSAGYVGREEAQYDMQTQNAGRSGVVRNGPGRYFLRVMGHAVRVAAAPVIPEVAAFGSFTDSPNDPVNQLTGGVASLVKAIKIGKDKVARSEAGQAINLSDGTVGQIHLATWDKTYLLPSIPRDGLVSASMVKRSVLL